MAGSIKGMDVRKAPSYPICAGKGWDAAPPSRAPVFMARCLLVRIKRPTKAMHLQGSRLREHQLFATTDLDEAREAVARVFCPHRLEIARARRVDALHNRVDLKGFSLNYLQYGADVDIDPGAMERFYLLQIPLAGSARVRCGTQEVEVGPDAGTFLSPSLDVSMRWSADCRKLLVQIERAALERLAEATLGHPLGRPLNFDVALDFNRPTHATVRRLVMLLCDDMETGGALGKGLTGASFADVLLTALIQGQRHSYTDAMEGRAASIAPAHVKKAERFMRERVAEPIGLPEIAQAAGVSVRALQDGFRRFRETTPLESLRAIRMEAARAELLAGACGETVTNVALKWGFTHLSRFAGTYRQRFGETPSQTLRHSGFV